MPATRVLIAPKLCALVALVTVAVLWSAPAGGPGGGAAHAQTFPLAHTLLSPTPAFDDQFGYSVAAVGGNVLAGARYDDTGAQTAGAAYLFDANTGALVRTFQKPTPAVGDVFGESLAAVGGNVLASARGDDTGAKNAGAAYLFDASSGALLRTFLNPTPASGDEFGVSVAALGGNVLVGAPLDDSPVAFNAGAAYLFDSASGGLLRTFINPTPAADDRFGISVAALGGSVLVGAYLDDTGALDAGAAYLFNANTGALLRTFLNPTPAYNDYFGWSVAAVGGNVLIGAPNDDAGAPDAGAAYLFDANTGALLQTFLNPTPALSDGFGVSVAAVGSNVLIGAYFDDTGALNAGAAYLFDAASGGLLRTFLDPTPAAGAAFGISVAAVGGNVLVGAPLDNAAGAAFLFCSPEGCPLGVGGVAELPAAAETPLEAPRSSGSGAGALAGIASAAAGAIALGGGAWWARRRRNLP